MTDKRVTVFTWPKHEYDVEPLVEAFIHHMSLSEPGAKIIYHTGKPGHLPTYKADVVNRLMSRDLVTLVQRPSAPAEVVNRTFVYMAVVLKPRPQPRKAKWKIPRRLEVL